MEERIVDLDFVLLSPATMDRFLKSIQDYLEKNGGKIKFNPAQIPDEQFRVLENGDGEIFVTMPSGEEFKVHVPKNEWTWNN